MTTAMIADCLTGLVRAVGMLLFVLISSECIYFLLFSESLEEAKEKYLFNPARLNRLFSGASNNAKENSACNRYRLELLFSGASNNAKENSACNPYRFKNATKLTAKALGFIFLHPCKYHSPILLRTSVARKDVFTNLACKKITTCL
jgi:hypothetical protein